MKRQEGIRMIPSFLGRKGGWVLGATALLALRSIGCASEGQSSTNEGPITSGGQSGTGGAAGAPTGAVCGNNALEPGEACDGTLTLTCASVTMGARPLGVVTCNQCQIDASGCMSSAGTGGSTSGSAGMPAGTGGVVSGTAGTSGSGTAGTPSGGQPGSGGTAAAGGTLGMGGTSSTGTSGSSSVLGDVDALRQVCVDTINMYRAMVGAAPLTLAAASVEMCSDQGAQADAAAGVAHGSAGKCPGMGAQDTCPGWPPKQYGGAENALKACLQSMWAEGEPPEGRSQCLSEYFSGNIACFEKYGHYLNMSDTSNSVVSCGFYVMPNGNIWMNQDLGR